MKFYNTPEDDALHIWNEAKRNDRVAKKLLNYYRKKQRKKKIEKLQSIDTHWKGLS
jgi:hypothetical protein